MIFELKITGQKYAIILNRSNFFKKNKKNLGINPSHSKTNDECLERKRVAGAWDEGETHVLTNRLLRQKTKACLCRARSRFLPQKSAQAGGVQMANALTHS
ncbi:MAG: hypothetical protein ACK4NS_06590 [Saprospiraceae bacterium]